MGHWFSENRTCVSGMESFEADIVVVGGGLSGLAAAYYLSKKDRGLRVLLLEAKGQILSVTFDHALHHVVIYINISLIR